jgi:hypothetical protein
VRPIGFSTGAIAYADFDRALKLLRDEDVTCIELSALRFQEARPLLSALRELDLTRYSYVSFHAPSSFDPGQEKFLVNDLREYLPPQWPIILHPDTIHDQSLWRTFRSQLAIENMDQRKVGGRTVEELAAVFEGLPEASFCFDIGHARQCDTSMTEAYKMLQAFQRRLAQVHVSEVNSSSQHDPVSYAAQIAFREVSGLIPANIPLIVESRVNSNAIGREIRRVYDALPEPVPTGAAVRRQVCQPYA